MGKSLSTFQLLDGFGDIYTATRDNLRCTAIRLRSGGLCLFSPVRGLGRDAVGSLRKLGDVEVLLAPNHWHNMGLREYAAAFPDASICTSPGARHRLEQETQLRFQDLTKLQRQLPPTLRFTFPSGLKTGEIWLSIGNARDRAWLVVDAFCGPKGKKRDRASEPDILGTFPKFSLGDRTIYVEWLERQIELDKPTAIVPCHGAVIVNEQLPDKLRRLIARKLKAA